MFFASSVVLWLWHGVHSVWKMLLKKASLPMYDQGNTWSTCIAWVTLPTDKQDIHNGFLDSCICLSCLHCLVWYILLNSCLSSDLGNVYVSYPPWDKHNRLHLLLGLLHPSSLHLVLLGRYGTYDKNRNLYNVLSNRDAISSRIFCNSVSCGR